MNFLIDFLLTIHIIVSLLLVGVVLLQRPRSEGLGTAFASGMVEQYIGPATSALVRFTTWMAGAFFFLTVALAVLYSHQNNGKSMIAAKLQAAAAAKASPTPARSLSPTVAPLVIPAVTTPVPEPPAAGPTASTAPNAAVAPTSPPAAALPPAAQSPTPAATPVVVTTTPVTVTSTARTDAAAPTPTVNPVATPNDVPAPAPAR